MKREGWGQSKIKYQHLPNPVRWICQNAIPHGFEEHWRFAVAKTPYRLSIFTSSCVIWLNFFVLGDRFVSCAPRSLFDKALVTMDELPLVWYANPVRRIRQLTIRHGFEECLNAVYLTFEPTIFEKIASSDRLKPSGRSSSNRTVSLIGILRTG